MVPRIPPPCFSLVHAEPITLEPGHAVIRFTATEELANPYGLVQGGLLVAMIDNCVGPAVYLAEPGRQSSTVELNVNFLAPARPGDHLVGDARVLKLGRTTAYLEASLTREDGTLVARASATQVFLGVVDIPAGVEPGVE